MSSLESSGNGALYATKNWNHPRADIRGRVYAHVLVAERILGKYLPNKAVVHHIDHDRHNNIPSNLVICQDQAYHMMLHRRERALKACGHANWFRCGHCRKWDTPENLYVKHRSEGVLSYHRECHAKAEKNRLQGRKVN